MNKFEERFDQLNDRQKEAVESIEGTVLVVAGPGSGKTELLALRTAQILKETQVSPHNILLLTFTDSASFNMRKRLVSLIGETGYRVNIYTFHSFAGEVINRYGEYFFGGASFSPISDIMQVSVVQDILKNLPRKNVLSMMRPEGFVYEADIISSISDLKKAGLDSQAFAKKLENNKDLLEQINKIIRNLNNSFESIAGKRKLEVVIPTYIELYEALKKENEIDYIKILLSSLELAISQAHEVGSATYLTKWKDEYLVKVETESGSQFTLRDSQEEKQEKLEALAEVYKLYTEEMHRRGLYDFDDMILLVGEALAKNPNLRYDLQERYQYILIDEFQDTNEAQFALAKSLCLDDEGKPSDTANIMAVGDDDQAIYKFQGAEIGNIFEFRKTFPTSKVIVLDKNYRSTQEVLDLARSVIVKAEDRLEVRDKNIIKDIKASNKKLQSLGIGEIVEKNFSDDLSEYEWIALEIKKLLDKNIEAKEIAVICRKHSELRRLSEVLSSYKVPFSYEKKEHILEKTHIKELIRLVEFADAAGGGKGEELLPEILAFPFWDLPKIEIWKLAEAVRKNSLQEDEFGKKKFVQVSFLETMLASDISKIREIAEFLISLSVDSKVLPLEHLLDKVIGTTEWLFDDEEKSDGEYDRQEVKGFVSPYRNYYFNKQNFDHNKHEYLEFLFALRTFVGALREFKQGEVVYAKDLQIFLDVYSGDGSLTLTSVSPFASSSNSISLMTAHKAKGLEFEYVFLLSADDDTWAGRGYSSKISFPKNMIYGPDRDNDDDKIRLLFVALTRAKHTVYITYSGEKVRYLGSKEELKEESGEISKETIFTLELSKKREFVEDEKALLRRLLEQYKLPVTHLNNFLNFTRVGPEKFVEQNILRFPQAMPAPAVYGTAMHAAADYIYRQYEFTSKFPELEKVLDVFTQSLLFARLPKQEFEKYKTDGLEKLENYYNFVVARGIAPNTKTEVKFGSEHVHLGDVPLTGAVDRLEIVGDEVVVTDIKTGKSFKSFETSKLDESDKIKLHFYSYQLAFYALLIKHSTTYSKHTVKLGKLEFIEGKKGKIETADLEINTNLIDRVQKLTEIVYKKILALDFPDTSNYPQTLKGILQFEDDLLSGKI